MMAFEGLEPFGSLHTEQMFGQVCATLLAPHMTKGKKPPSPSDFFPALRRFLDGYRPEGAILLDDLEAQSQLIKQQIFGVKDV